MIELIAYACGAFAVGYAFGSLVRALRQVAEAI